MRRVLVLLILLAGPLRHTGAGEAGSPDAARPIQALLVTGGCCHDYDRQKRILTQGISARADVRWTVVHQGGTTTDTPIPLYNDPNWADGFDVVVHNECFSDVTDPEFVDRILAPHRAGTPAILIHCAMHCYRVGDDRWFEFVGLQSPGHGPHYSYTAENLRPRHPVMESFGQRFVAPKGELYHAVRVFDTATPLAQANRQQDGLPQVCVWTNDYRGTRVFGCTMGHYNETMVEPQYLDLLARAVLWAVGRDPRADFRPTTEVEDQAIRKLAVAKLEPVPESEPTDECCRDGNLLHQKPAEATSEETQKNNLVAHAVDGHLTTRWCAGGPQSGEALTVDLEQPTQLRAARIHWESPGTAYRYRVDVSADGDSWQTVADRSENTAANGLAVEAFAQVTARFFRVTFLGSNTGGWASIREIEAVDGDLPALPEGLSTDRSPAPAPSDIRTIDGFTATVFAEPPDVNYPVCLTTGINGDVYVGVDDQGSLGKDPGRGKILRCVDTDGDGVADEINEFARVDHPRGLIFDNGSLWVLHPPFLSVFHDRDRDGVADTSDVLVRGISTDQVKQRGADHTTNGIRLGIDGWIYIAVGDFGFHRAVGTDGSELSRRGGGVVRVRPDGSELEIYAWGLRNIVDVAIDPSLNLFTRDNTNDGGGWDVRLSHILQTANYGYPSLFQNFTDETMPPLADYGGGSGCGVVCLHDERWPEGFRDLLFTCDWGRSEVYSHRLRPNGATFDPQQSVFLKIPRPTDIDVDASGRMYVSSWKNGQFRYEGPNVGFVAQILPDGFVPHPVPDLTAADPATLVAMLSHPAARARIAVQRELLRRIRQADADVPDVGQLHDIRCQLIALIRSGEAPLATRTAAVWTLKQGFGCSAHRELEDLAALPAVREHCLRALADRRSQLVPVRHHLFLKGLTDENPRVQAAAVIGLGRLISEFRTRSEIWDGEGGQQIAEKLGELLFPLAERTGPPPDDDTDAWRQPDPGRVLPHLVTRTLVAIDAVEACLQQLDPLAAERPHQAAALQAISDMHCPRAVDGLFHILSRTHDPVLRREVWTALIRLAHREGDFTPDSPGWWGTRPDTSGPLYDRQPWSETERIVDALRVGLREADADLRQHLFDQMRRHHVQPEGIATDTRTATPQPETAVVLPRVSPDHPDQIGNLATDEVLRRVGRAEGNAAAGAELFQRQSCARCHTWQNGQRPRGPHLADIGKRYRRDELLESILQPDRRIAQGFDTWLFVLKSGRIETGFIAGESAETVTIRGTDGLPREIPQQAIEERIKQDASQMPKGLVANLTPEQLADLVAWLESLR